MVQTTAGVVVMVAMLTAVWRRESTLLQVRRLSSSSTEEDRDDGFNRR